MEIIITYAKELKASADGTIQKVIPTLRRVGLTKASGKIHLDRYSLKSEKGSSIEFLDTLNRFEGRKTLLEEKGAWIQYNAVDFGTEPFQSVKVKALSRSGAKLQISLDRVDGPEIAEVEIPVSEKWETHTAFLKSGQTGIQNLVLSLTNEAGVEIDYLSFK